MILASELDLDSLLQRIADLSRDVVEARYAAVGVVGSDGSLARFVYSGIDKATADRIGHLPEGKGLLGVLLEEGKPLRLLDIADHPRSHGFPEGHPPMKTFLGVPIVIRGRVFGRLYLSEKRDGSEFSKNDERIALTLASQAGVAVENARLYDEIGARSIEVAKRVLELSSVERVGQLLIGEDSLDSILDTAAAEAVKLTGATLSTVSLLDKASGDLIVRSVAGIETPHLIGTHLGRGRSKAFAVMERGKGECVADLSVDEEIDSSTRAILGDPTSGAFVPLMVRSKGIGALAVYDRSDGQPFDEEDLDVLQILANQIAIAVENDRLTQSLQSLAILEERERISKELHDGVIQSIYSVGLSLQGTVSLLDRDPELANSRIQVVIAELDNVVRDVRAYIFELQPRLVEGREFGEAVAELARELEINTLAHVSVDIPAGACDVFDERQRSNVIQIVREIFSNIARHAEASEVSVVCRAVDEEVNFEIEDNGKTFDPDRVKRGQGLRNIELRARNLGGKISIESLGKGGTRHRLSVPVPRR